MPCIVNGAGYWWQNNITIMENFGTETTNKQRNYAWDELSLRAKKMLRYIWQQTIGSPLQFCRIMQENATGEKYNTLLEVERYLIDED